MDTQVTKVSDRAVARELLRPAVAGEMSADDAMTPLIADIADIAEQIAAASK